MVKLKEMLVVVMMIVDEMLMLMMEKDKCLMMNIDRQLDRILNHV